MLFENALQVEYLVVLLHPKEAFDSNPGLKMLLLTCKESYYSAYWNVLWLIHTKYTGKFSGNQFSQYQWNNEKKNMKTIESNKMK